MTTADAVTSTDSAADKINTYYVVPVTPDPTAESVWYFTDTPGGGKWTRVAHDDLDAARNGSTKNEVILTQPLVGVVNDWAPSPLPKYDPSVHLYAGIVKTLKKNGKDEDSYCQLNVGKMLIKVAPNEPRGLILVFTKDTDGTLTSLMASTDPEIKNSVGI